MLRTFLRRTPLHILMYKAVVKICFFFMYVIRIHELVDTLLIRRYNTLLTSFATFVRRNHI